MLRVIDILDTYGKVGVELLKAKVRPLNATGKTEESIRYEVEEKDGDAILRIYGRGYFKALETGRGPRQSSEYGEFDVRLEEWMQARGFSSKTSKSGVRYFKIGDYWYSGKSLAYMINKRGDSIHRKGGRQVYSDDLGKLVDEIGQKILQDFLKEIKWES